MPDPTVYYPASSNAVLRARAPSTTAKGSFGPVFAVLAAISFLAVAACVAGRLCGRRLSRKRYAADQDSYASDSGVGGDLEKGGFEIKYPPAMKPVASSRATIHDIDDGFEIKFAPGKPPAWKSDGKLAGSNKGRQLKHQQQPQLVGVPKGYAVPKDYAGFRYPAQAVAVAVDGQGQIRGGAFVPAKPGT